MGRIDKNMLDFVVSSYKQLKNDTNEKSTVIKRRYNDERYIDFIMQKHDFYYGSYVLYESSVYVCSFTEESLELLTQAFEKMKETPNQ